MLSPAYGVNNLVYRSNVVFSWSIIVVFEYRTSVNPAQLVLTSVVKQDSGVYKCRVDYRYGRVRGSTVMSTYQYIQKSSYLSKFYLSVHHFIYRSFYISIQPSIYLSSYLSIYLSTYLSIYLPRNSPTVLHTTELVAVERARKPIILDDEGVQVMGTVGPYRLRQPLILVCVGEGAPPPDLVWLRNGEVWDAEKDPGVGAEQKQRNTLVIPALGRDNAADTFTCQV